MENQYLIDKNRYAEDVKNGIFPEKILIEKQVWESTLNRSMVLQAENEKLKDVLRLCRGRFSHYTAYDDEMMVKIIDEVL